MAEVLGTVASGIAVAQLTGQVGAATLKLVKLWNYIQDMPESITDLLEELAEMDPLITAMETALMESNLRQFSESACLTRSLESSRRAMKSLSEVVSDLDKKIQSSQGFRRKLVNFKVALKKEDVKKLERKLSRSLKTLQFAWELYSKASQKFHADHAFAQLRSELLRRLDRPCQRPDDEAEAVSDGKEKERLVLVSTDKNPLLVPYQSSTLGQFGVQSNGLTKLIYFQAPYWIGRSALEFLIKRPITGLQMTIRTHSVRPKDAEIFQRVRKGDVSGVIDLLQAGRASLFDHDDLGNSLLSIAAKALQVELSEMLLQVGLLDYIDENNSSTSGPLITLVNNLQAKKDHDPRYKALVAVYQAALRKSDPISPCRLLDVISEPDFSDQFLGIFHENFFPDYRLRPLRDRLEAMRLGAFWVQDPNTLLKLLQGTGDIIRMSSEFDQLQQNIIRDSAKENFSVLHSVAIALGERCAREVNMTEKPWFREYRFYEDDWREIVEGFVERTDPEDLHLIETVAPPEHHVAPVWTGTPLISLLGGALAFLLSKARLEAWDVAIQRVVAEWTRALQTAGVDLVEYGRKESEIWISSDVKGAFDSDAGRASRVAVRPAMSYKSFGIKREPFDWRVNRDRGPSIRLIQLEYGSRPEDWHVTWLVETEDMVEEFLAMAERPVSRMPGTWIE